jgi:2-polyprenyl-3-methyl-5-hydroxy-6-metoxy-1,4-benzoquinol methylase
MEQNRVMDGAEQGRPTQPEGFTRGPTLSELNAEFAADASAWPRFERCPVCASARIAKLAAVRHMPYDRCRSCGFVFCNPYPPESVRDAFYNSAFYTNYRILEDLARARDPYFSISTYIDMRTLAGRLAELSPASVLDYGCGTGSFLALLRDEFGMADVHGLEISSQARERANRAYGLTIAADAAELAHDTFDAVLLLEVIEHVPDPLAFLDDVVARVAPGGVLVITTPAVDNLVGRHLVSQCAHYTAPSHVSLFTSRSMHTLLDRQRLVPVRVDTDSAHGTARALVRSLLYSLDFRSPEHAEDDVDALYHPTALGRRLGLTETRTPSEPGLASRAIPRIDRLLERVHPRPDHLYVIARRPG